jgi:tetratricopeptide (TPR) repeat protein
MKKNTKNKPKIVKDPHQIYPESLRNTIDKIVHDSVTKHINYYKKILYAFSFGISIFIAIGLLTKGQLFEIILKNIYKPAHIYTDIKPKLKKGIWETVSSGSEDDYCNFVSKNEFYNALKKYHTELVKTFLVPNRSPVTRAREILRVGTIKEDVHILMGGKHLEGRVTARCYKKFLNSTKQAILVIPKSFERSEYSWYDCSFGWPTIFLSIEYEDKVCNNVKLVGVRRNGKTKYITILISKKVAKDIDIPGWNNYTANGYGKIFISKVDDITKKQYEEDKSKDTEIVSVPSKSDNKLLSNTSYSNKKLTVNIDQYKLNNDINHCLELFHEKKYQLSYKKFEHLLSSTIDNKTRAFIMFMMGECQYKNSEYDIAILDYQKIISNQPNSKVVPSALLKQALSFQQLTDQETAKIIFKKLISEFPATPEANEAKAILRSM